MRADRLLAILLLLQSHRRLTAGEVAERLGVSLRTVQRDMLALSVAGAPVYAERGSKGGWSLLEGYHTDLSGLSPTEIHSLTLQAPARLLDDLGLRQASATGLVKLLSGLPDAQRRTAEELRQRVYVDAAGWRATDESAPMFAVMQEAVWRDMQARIEYQRSDGEVVERVVEPLGLVAKGRIWYVVARVDGEMRTYRASRIHSASLLDAPVTRPAGFDLAAYWDATQAQFTASLPRYPVVARLRADLLDWARAMWRYTRFDSISQPDDSGWLTLEITFESAREACFCLLGLGGAVEALQPAELRALIRERAAAASLRHAASGGGSGEPAAPAPLESAAGR
ncbi:MAG TPA: YafY family protein [Ktedonobacterales bacterium]